MANLSDSNPLNIAEELRLEEVELNDWPRRLLHVPTWTSHEWQPGNIYGDHVAPPYNAISYTWGRWRLVDNDMLDVPSLPIQNTTWRIPRVDPQHFSVEEFRTVIQHACTQKPHGYLDDFPLPAEANTFESTIQDREVQHATDVSFLWLDIACIHQQWNSPWSAAEIGRQAKIFRGARRVFAWLTTQTRASLEHHFAKLDRITESLDHARFFGSADCAKNIHEALEILETISSDPWFSSLWTLQESHLRRDAFIMTCQGELVCHPDFASIYINLDHLLTSCGVLNGFCKDFSYARSIPQAFIPELYELLNRKGLAQLGTKSPMAVFGVASQRCASKECDYVYGIQQIFGLRVGISSLSADYNRTYTKQELEDQLGEGLMRQNPLISQCYVYRQPTKIGMAWRINMDSVVPDCAPFTLLFQEGVKIEQRCILSTHSASRRLLGYFNAPMCSLDTLKAACHRADWTDGFVEYSHRNAARLTLAVFPDVSSELQDAPESPMFGNTVLLGGVEQRDYIDWLVKAFQDDQAIQVLCLGYVNGQGSRGGYHSGCFGIGLLMKSSSATRGQDPGAPDWRRLGLCTWDSRYRSMSLYSGGRSSDRLLLEGKTLDWINQEGTFG